ncbi:keratin-associated protein 13-1-like [Diceros bicornis minor]|uniref:keratin-associated protein 13-1-like n=1 Tax=Diceros bicornis minor TaxID=77932 RepID=UPI0026EA0FF8|nr:keratin-associated protein 13-1-like [Diceros bicornis minor]
MASEKVLGMHSANLIELEASNLNSAKLTSPVNVSYNCCSGKFSSLSLGGYLHYPGSSCGSSYPSNLVYGTDFCSLSNCQLGSSLYSGCQRTCWEPTRYQAPCVVSSPCQRSCYHPRISTLWSPCQSTYAGFLGSGSSSCCSLAYGSRSCYSGCCGSSGFSPPSFGVHGFSSLTYGSRFCRPTYLPSRSCETSCYQRTCRSSFYY